MTQSVGDNLILLDVCGSALVESRDAIEASAATLAGALARAFADAGLERKSPVDTVRLPHCTKTTSEAILATRYVQVEAEFMFKIAFLREWAKHIRPGGES